MDEINVQTQNFNADNIGDPAVEPKSNSGLKIGIIIFVVIIIAAGAAYYFLSDSKTASIDQEQSLINNPVTVPQVNGPQAPPPGQSDDLDSISNDLDAMDLNSLEQSIGEDAKDLDSLLQ